jgi:enamine deaminase RidA (YjgF/YER057c/UK114 family)/predicted amidohydrolase
METGMRSFTATLVIAFLVAAFPLPQVRSAEPVLRFIDPNKETGTSQAVEVAPVALAHTAQLLPIDSAGRIVGKDNPAAQIDKVLDNVAAALAEVRSGFDQTIKVNVYVRRAQLVSEVQKALAKRFAGEVKPAVTFVEGILPHPDALVAMDAVAAIPAERGTEVKRARSATLPGAKNTSQVAILPAGPHVYVSGQAGAGKDIRQVTRETMEGLRATLKHLGLKDAHVVQVKTFLNPMSAVGDVEKEIANVFGDQPVPPLVFVEWKYDLPIEIELIAAAPAPKEKAKEPIEFLTLPMAKPSPVYSQIARINHGKLIYISGLYGKSTKAEAQVQEVFSALDQLLAKTGSDSRHLAKATYYVVDEPVTNQLGEFRKKYYDPSRPPAASKAKVSGVGMEGKTITIDMIAVAAPQRITLAQIFVTKDIDKNLERMSAAFAQAKKDKAQWIMFPEGALSGYYGGFDQDKVADAFAKVENLCREARVCGLIGTCWKEDGKAYNQIRLIDADGKLAGRYGKMCLTYGDAKVFAPGTFPLVHPLGDFTVGTLICNDLWVTPGFSDGPNPHLTLQMAKAGAQVIFHAVSSGPNQKFRDYHESNLKVRSMEAKCPIVVVNSACDQASNCTSGVVQDGEYVETLPRQGEVIRTVTFTPAAKRKATAK